MRIKYQELRAICLKPDENEKPFYARHITHTFSIFLIWLFQNSNLKPNAITFVSLILAFSSLPFFAKMSSSSVLLGMFLVECYYILDAVDGQWARFKKLRSLTGAFFDVLINYAIQPPICFAIGWGVYRCTHNALFLLLGFLAAFSTLWVILIWTIRASILLQSPVRTAEFQQPSSNSAPSRLSLQRRLFSGLHKSLVFPWFMHALTVTSILSALWALASNKPALTSTAFSLFLLYYGIIGPCIAVTLTTYWILTRKLDSDNR